MARVLVVDDDRDILRFTEKLLLLANHDVFLAADAIEAMELINSTPFDAMLCDANMPQYNGFELVQTVRNNKRFENMTIAMLTGQKRKEDIERAIKLGVDDYIIKPLEPQMFLQKIEKIFERHPPEKRPEVHMPANSTYAQAHLNLDGVITYVSELGFNMETSFPVAVGKMVKVSAPLFDHLKSEPPQLKVLSCQEVDVGKWKVRIAFLGITEAFLQNLRSWMYNQTRLSGSPQKAS